MTGLGLVVALIGLLVGVLVRFIVVYILEIVQKHVLGYKKESEPGSNFRRGFSRFMLIASFLMILLGSIYKIYFEEFEPIMTIYGLFFTFLSLIFFTTNVVIVVFKQDHNFQINHSRLFFDILISSLAHISSFTFVYRAFRILGPENRFVQSANFVDHFYFSAVTFSTLGYGDFKPSGDARLLAAYEALIGNMHLGFLVGAAYLAANSWDANR